MGDPIRFEVGECAGYPAVFEVGSQRRATWHSLKGSATAHAAYLNNEHRGGACGAE